MEYASKGIGTAGLTTGIIGTALGALGNGSLGNLFGSRNESDEFVTRYDINLMRELTEKDRKIALLEADKYCDQKLADFADRVNERFAGVEQQINAQTVWNATQTGTIACLQGQIAQLQSMTKLIIPNSSVVPGWGNVTISPAANAASAG